MAQVKDQIWKQEASSKLLFAMVNGMIDMSNIQTGSFELQLSVFSATAMMGEFNSIYQR